MSDTELAVSDIAWAPAPPHLECDATSDEDLLVATLVESDSYRQLAQCAIHELHDLRRELDRLRKKHHRLVEEYRALRVQTLRAAA